MMQVVTYIKQHIFNGIDLSLINKRHRKIFSKCSNVYISKCLHIALFGNIRNYYHKYVNCSICNHNYKFSTLCNYLRVSNMVCHIIDVICTKYEHIFECCIKFKRYLSWPTLKSICVICNHSIVCITCKKFYKHKYVLLTLHGWGFRLYVLNRRCIFIL